mmetsp:Transcript_1012/g.3475  ORF Transcript_1012/g.3475 Transcript_1012/m.3475 type:complete len:245 (-) Transcript_1012:976-1710(-)
MDEGVVILLRLFLLLLFNEILVFYTRFLGIELSLVACFSTLHIVFLINESFQLILVLLFIVLIVGSIWIHQSPDGQNLILSHFQNFLSVFWNIILVLVFNKWTQMWRESLTWSVSLNREEHLCIDAIKDPLRLNRLVASRIGLEFWSIHHVMRDILCIFVKHNLSPECLHHSLESVEWALSAEKEDHVLKERSETLLKDGLSIHLVVKHIHLGILLLEILLLYLLEILLELFGFLLLECRSLGR